jgi:hypothetical protein
MGSNPGMLTGPDCGSHLEVNDTIDSIEIGAALGVAAKQVCWHSETATGFN